MPSPPRCGKSSTGPPSSQVVSIPSTNVLILPLGRPPILPWRYVRLILGLNCHSVRRKRREMSPDAGQRASDAGITVASTAKDGALALSTRARLALIAAGALLIAAGFWLWTLWHALKLHQGQYDFSQYYAAGYALRHNPHADIYSRLVLSTSGIAAHVLAPIPVPYPYPPLSAILFAPLTLASFPTAATLFLVVNVGLWLTCALLIASEIRHLLGTSLAASTATRVTPPRRVWARIIADPTSLVALALSALLLFVSRPAAQTLEVGQINFAVLLPLAAIPWLSRHRHERWVGIAIAVAAMLKVTPVLLLAYLVVRRRWEALGAALAALVVLALASIAVVGPDVFFQAPLAILRIGGADTTLHTNESMLGPAINAVATAIPAAMTAARVIQYLLLAALATGIGWLIRSISARPGRDVPMQQTATTESLAYAVALPAVVLLSPVAWAHHYVWLAPAAAIVLAVALRAWAEAVAPHHRRALLVLVAAGIACVLVNMALPKGWDTDPTVPGLLFGLPLRPWLQELRPLGGLLVVALAATLLLRTRTTTTPARKASWIRPHATSELPAPLPASQWRRTVSQSREISTAMAGPATTLESSNTIASRLGARGRVILVMTASALLLAGFAGWLFILVKAIETRAGRFDFSGYYAAARALRLDPHANIYSPAVIAANAIAGHVLAPPTMLYVYTPLPALLLAPLTAFPFPVAANIFLAVNMLVWLLCMLLIAREVRHLLGTSLATRNSVSHGPLAKLLADPAPLVALAVCAPLFFLGRPGVWTLGNGQINFLVLLPLASVPWLTRRGSEYGVGVAIAVATMLKLTPGVLLLYLLLRRRWHALGAALVSLAVLSALCLIIVGPHVFFAFPATTLHIGSRDSLEAHNEALVAPVLFALTSASPALAPAARMCEYVVLGLLAVELGVILWRSRPIGAIHLSADLLRREALANAMALSAFVLLSPTAWAHHYVWLLPPAAIVLALAIRAIAIQPAYARDGRMLLLLLVGAIVAGVLLNLPLPKGWDTDPTVPGLLFGLPLRPWLQELRPLGGLLVVALAATLLLRTRATTTPARKASWIRPHATSELPAPLPASQR